MPTHRGIVIKEESLGEVAPNEEDIIIIVVVNGVKKPVVRPINYDWAFSPEDSLAITS
jgi:hypothetical protein